VATFVNGDTSFLRRRWTPPDRSSRAGCLREPTAPRGSKSKAHRREVVIRPGRRLAVLPQRARGQDWRTSLVRDRPGRYCDCPVSASSIRSHPSLSVAGVRLSGDCPLDRLTWGRRISVGRGRLGNRSAAGAMSALRRGHDHVRCLNEDCPHLVSDSFGAHIRPTGHHDRMCRSARLERPRSCATGAVQAARSRGDWR
jgi:hypothetical protein